MKKILFSCMALVAMNFANAQNVVWSENFDDLDISDWTIFDADGDNYKWSAVQTTDANNVPVGTPLLTSASYMNGLGPLTPDNWATSPMIDLTNASGTITLKYGVFASDPDWNSENYTVYVSTTNNHTDTSLFTPIFTEPSVPGTETVRTLDISSYAGSQIYISFRHHDITDMYRINIDNISVEASTLNINEVNLSKTSIYPNPAVNDFKINLGTEFDKNKLEITITDLVGKKVKSFGLKDSYNVSDLSKGVYLITITDGVNKTSQKLIKN